jgi:hypothetical protein
MTVLPHVGRRSTFSAERYDLKNVARAVSFSFVERSPWERMTLRSAACMLSWPGTATAPTVDHSARRRLSTGDAHVISALERLERLLAGVVEGAATRWFPGGASAPSRIGESHAATLEPALLSVARGAGAPPLVEVGDGEVRIGRASDNDLVLDDRAVSRHHAAVRRDAADGFVVIDLGSANGTHLNGRRVHQSALHHGDCLRLGQTEVVFREHRA